MKQLQDQLQSQEDDRTPFDASASEQRTKRLQKELLTKDNQLMDMQLTNDSLSDNITLLEKQVQFLNVQMKTFLEQNGVLGEQIAKLETELDNRDKMNVHLSQNNSELEEHLRDLRSQLNKSGLESSFDLLNGSVSEHSQNGNTSFVMPENLANAVVDVRLVDERNQNQRLTEELNGIRSELMALRTENIDMLAKMADSQGRQISTVDDIDDISAELRSLIVSFVEQNRRQSEKISTSETQIENLIESSATLEKQVNETMAATNRMRKDLKTAKEELATSQEECQKLSQEIASTATELQSERVTNENEPRERAKSAASFEQQKSLFNQQLGEAKESISKRDGELQQCQTKVSQLQQNLTLKESTLVELEASKKAIEEQLVRATEEANAFKQTVEQLNKANDHIRSELCTVNDTARIAQEQHAEIVEDLSILKTNHEALLADNAALSAKVKQVTHEWQAKCAALDESLVANKRSLSVNDKEIAELRTLIAKSEQQLQKMAEDKEVIVQQLVASDASKATIEEQIVSVEKQLAEMAEAKQVLQSKLDSSEEAVVVLKKVCFNAIFIFRKAIIIINEVK